MRPRPIALRGALALVLLLGLAAPVRAADTIDDLLFDLQLVPMDQRPAPAFTLPSLEGRKVALSHLRGQAVLLYFWATW